MRRWHRHEEALALPPGGGTGTMVSEKGGAGYLVRAHRHESLVLTRASAPEGTSPVPLVSTATSPPPGYEVRQLALPFQLDLYR